MIGWQEEPSSPHVPMAAGEEFDAIRTLLSVWGPLAEGIGDDAAVFVPPAGEQLVVTTDASVEDVHFRASWLTAEEIGARAAAAAFSDIAAMGARALAVLIALELPVAWLPMLAGLGTGIAGVVRESNARIIGGNITRADKLALTLTVLGASDRPVHRRGAEPGDALWVTGQLGGPGMALASLLRDETPTAAHRARFAAPTPRLREGAWLAAVGAHAMIDLSDGLAADAAHLASASGVECELWTESVPCLDGVSIEQALAGGEEYELLVATAPDLDADGFARRFGVPLTRIGTVRSCTDGVSPRVVLRAREGDTEPVRVDLPAGHDHLS